MELKSLTIHAFGSAGTAEITWIAGLISMAGSIHFTASKKEDLCTYIKGLRKFSPSALQIDDFPDFYIYKMASSVYEKADEYGNMSRNLVVDDLGFLK